MGNEYYGAPTTPTSDYLAHYGIKGMKWGVRKARESGNVRALGRQYRKAEKKLAKLERQAASGKKYAKRAAALGIGAAAAGGLAAAGTRGVGIGVANLSGAAAKASKATGNALQRASHVLPIGVQGRNKVRQAGNALVRAGRTGEAGAGGIVRRGANASKAIMDWGNQTSALGKNASIMLRKGNNSWGVANPLRGVTKGTVARVGAGAAGLGLAAGAGYNAYRAATTKRAAEKAAQFRKEMNKAFAGTQYANGGGSRKRKRR